MEGTLYNSERKSKEVDPATIAKRNELFQKHVAPYFKMIYKLCIQYTSCPEDVEENYNEVLVNFYRGIETYDPNRSILTWLHIVTKRHVFELDRRRRRRILRDDDHDIDTYRDMLANNGKPSANLMGLENYREFYSDEILEVLDMMKPIHRDALLLQQAGYSLKEIAEIEHDRGTLKSHNIETIKSRLFLARQFMKNHLTRDGKRKVDKEYNDCL